MIRSASCTSACGLAVLALAVLALAVLAPAVLPAEAGPHAPRPDVGAYDALVAKHAAANGIPPSLVHRVIVRESRYNPRAVNGGNYGIMQIRVGTARAMGYAGPAAGLLDADTNMTYAVKYLAGAYRAAGGNEGRAVAYYAGGYYHHARRLSSAQAETRAQTRRAEAPVAPGTASSHP